MASTAQIRPSPTNSYQTFPLFGGMDGGCTNAVFLLPSSFTYGQAISLYVPLIYIGGASYTQYRYSNDDFSFSLAPVQSGPVTPPYQTSINAVITLSARNTTSGKGGNIWNCSPAARQMLMTNFVDFCTQIECQFELAAAPVLIPGATQLIAQGIAEVIPAPLTETLFYRYGFNPGFSGAAQPAIDLHPGMRLRIEFEASLSIAQADSADTSIYLTTGWGVTTLDVLGATVALPLSGAGAGCLQFAAQLGQTSGVSDLIHLDAGLRSYYPTPTGTATLDSADDPIWISSLRYPVFSEQQPTLALYGNLDPLTQDDARTYFAFNAVDAGLPAASTAPVGSYYSSTLGHQFALLPLSAAAAPSAFARLAFATNPASYPPGPSDPLYLVPKGDFAVQLPPVASAGGTESPPALRLMGGMSGVEYVALQPDATNVLSFFSGQPAYVPDFDPTRPPTNTTLANAPDAPTTAWAFLSAQQSSAAAAAQPVTLTYFA